MTRRGLTEIEAKVLRVIRAFHRLDPPRAPILREIAEAMDWPKRSTSAASQYVRQLEAAGYVTRSPGRPGVHLAE